MGRLIEVQDARMCPPSLTVQVGDVLLFHASGGHVRSGGEAVELLPPLLSAVLGEDGTVVAPQGAPNTLLVRAHRPGRATLEVLGGDPWHAPQATSLAILIAP